MSFKRILRWAALLVVGVILGGVIYGWSVWRGGKPQRDGEARLPGLGAAAKVRFDAWGVPHVLGQSEADLAAALGFLHANDRMTQLELGRRSCMGRLAEVVGEAALPLDRRSLHLRLRQTAEKLVASASPNSQIWLANYAAGVNAWLEANRGELPPELRVLGTEPAPWVPADSLCFAVLMARDLSMGGGFADDFNFLVAKRLGIDKASDLIGPPGLFVPAGLMNVPTPTKTAAAGPLAAQPDETRIAELPAALRPSGFGSNNWAVGASRSVSGSPLVANDPHLPLSLPSVWYQVHLRAGNFEVAGMSLPGLPGVVIGQTPRLAWALTFTQLDDHDLFYEELDETGKQVRRGEGWQALETETVQIPVRGGDAVPLELARTDRGPLFPAVPERGLPPRSLAWSMYEPSDPLAAIRGLVLAEKVDDVPTAITGFVAPTQNLVVADREGGLVFTLLGRIPKRRVGDGQLPMPAADKSYGWVGVLPAQENPVVLRPADELLVTANNNVFPPDYPRPVSAFFDLDARARRIRELLLARPQWDEAEFAKMQTDTVSLYAQEVVQLLGQAGWEGDAKTAHDALAAWDGAMSQQGGAALFALVDRELKVAIFGDEAKQAEMRPFGDNEDLLRVLRGEMVSAWFDNVSTPVAESRQQTLNEALAKAYRLGKQNWGPEVGNWVYTSVHTLDLQHPLGALPLAGRLLSRGPLPVTGSGTSIAAFGGFWQGPVQSVTFGPSMRWISNVVDPDRSVVMLLGGQAGHPSDPHYDDQVQGFLAGETRRVAWSEEAIAKATVSTLVLKP